MLLFACAAPDPEGGASGSAGSGPTDAPVEVVPDAEAPPADELPGLYVSEVMSWNEGVVEDGDGESPDWIELFHPGPGVMELGGWVLHDGGTPLVFPARTVQPGEFLVVWADSALTTGEALHAPFSISSAGETLTLVAPDGRVAQVLDVPALRADTSWGPAQVVTEARLFGPGDPLRYSTSPPKGWQTGDVSAWAAGTLPLGFDAGGGGEATEVSLFAPTDQSSDGYGYTGAQATDGELSTFSHTGDADLTPWWQADLGQEWEIRTITLHNRRDCCAERLYNVVVSVVGEAGTTWTSEVLNPVVEGATPTSPGSSLALTPGAVGRWVRVDKTAVNGASSSEWLSLAEVVVSGAEPNLYADLVATELPVGTAAVAWAADLEAPEATRLVWRAGYDDRYAAWLDGLPVAAGGAEGQAHDGRTREEVPVLGIEPGPRRLAVEVSNVAADDPDLYFDGELVAQQIPRGAEAYFVAPTPGAPNGAGDGGWVETPTASPGRGFYDAEQSVELAVATPGATLVYTLDGSEPTLEHGVVVAGGEAGAWTTVPVATTTVLRARAFADDRAPSDHVSHTYLFLEDVIRQDQPAGYPATWDDPAQGSFTADYAMDPEVVDDPAYHEDLLAGLREIPTLSIVMDPADLFGDAGIYVHSLERGADWERAAQLELILPDGTTGFATRAGLRIHGYGWRYHSATLKYAFRLEFSSDYGPTSLAYPWFPDAAAERFDSIVLRAQGSRGWQDFRDPAQACYVRDAFARDLAASMGKVDGHATYVHLYLNGLYWGLYMPVERPDAGFGERYLGGDDADYDAVNRRTSTNEAIDGTLDAYNELLALVDQDVNDPAVWAEIEARLQLDDLVDYMLIQQYTVNRDGPCCFDHNNMRGVASRALGVPYHFFLWDMEYSVWYAEDDTNVDVDVPGSASHMYARLRGNAAFRELYAERAAAALAGPLSPEATAAAWEARATSIENAVVAESARWGDARREPPYTRDVEWQAERERLLSDFFPARTDALAEQLRAAGLLR